MDWVALAVFKMYFARDRLAKHKVVVTADFDMSPSFGQFNHGVGFIWQLEFRAFAFRVKQSIMSSFDLIGFVFVGRLIHASPLHGQISKIIGIDAVPFEQLVHTLARKTSLAGGAGDDAFVLCQQLIQISSVGVVECFVSRNLGQINRTGGVALLSRFAAKLRRQVTDLDRGASCQRNGTFDNVSQLADVARPMIPTKAFDRQRV